MYGVGVDGFGVDCLLDLGTAVIDIADEVDDKVVVGVGLECSLVERGVFVVCESDKFALDPAVAGVNRP